MDISIYAYYVLTSLVVTPMLCRLLHSPMYEWRGMRGDIFRYVVSPVRLLLCSSTASAAYCLVDMGVEQQWRVTVRALYAAQQISYISWASSVNPNKPVDSLLAAFLSLAYSACVAQLFFSVSNLAAWLYFPSTLLCGYTVFLFYDMVREAARDDSVSLGGI